MKPIHRLNIVLQLPPKIARLRELAFNLFWSWDPDTRQLFRRLDRDLWYICSHNPVALLGSISQKALDRAATDLGFLAHYDRVCARFDEYMKSKASWYYNTDHLQGNWCIGYFSMEFGVSDCLPIYSGGLGILSGDHMKSVSDLGVPLVGVGLLYQKGYFRQYLNSEGMQQELYPINDFFKMPVEMVRDEQGNPVKIKVEFPKRDVFCQIWTLTIGRTKILLLDTNLPENWYEDQVITNELYGGGDELRIKQEMILGIGGVRALKALGYSPLLYHMNEGHAAFLGIERVRAMMQEKSVNFQVALEAVKAGQIFTTHTPVPAGIDKFSPGLLDSYLAGYRTEMGLSVDEFMGLGREVPSDKQEFFSMAILAINLSSYCNGVSQLHGKVSRNMWHGLWRGVPVEEVPIKHVTNGVHYKTWLHSDYTEIFDRYVGPKWAEDPSDTSVWKGVDLIPEDELWHTHERLRERLIVFARKRLREQLQKRSAPASDLEAADKVLDSRALTIGFARRFATYKRATLITQDVERLIKILSNQEKPVQIIFAGKAHPRDTEGKLFIKKIVQMASRHELRNKIVFLEDYDMIVAKYLVQGCDIWLNNPRRNEEASGTSGMKAAINGVLNLSILDGWWWEAYHQGIGWAIGPREGSTDNVYQDHLDAKAIYDLLEMEAVPLFYDRGADGLPKRWVSWMKAVMKELCPGFNSNRMVADYTQRAYLPCVKRSHDFLENDLKLAKELANWKAHVNHEWHNVKIVDTRFDNDQKELRVGDSLSVEANVYLGGLTPEDVQVEIYEGPIDVNTGDIDGQGIPMKFDKMLDNGQAHFVGKLQCTSTGRYGVNFRVFPYHKNLANPFELAKIKWMGE